MWIILLSLLIGTLLGVALRNQRRLLHWIDRGAITAVYLLLFLLGISVGGNQTVMNALGSLGIQALALTVGGVAGSLFLTSILERLLFQQNK